MVWKEKRVRALGESSQSCWWPDKGGGNGVDRSKQLGSDPRGQDLPGPCSPPHPTAWTELATELKLIDVLLEL